MEEVDSLRLARAVAIARKAVTMARVLLAETTALSDESKREGMARWLVESEKELIAFDPPKAPAVAAPSQSSFSSSSLILSPESQETLRAFPQRSFGVAVESFGQVVRGSLVEIVCRLPEGVSMVRPARQGKQQPVQQVEHRKLVVVQEGSGGMNWAVAECRAVVGYAGAGPELSLVEGDSVVVIKVNSNGWWKGLKGAEAATGLFPASVVEVTKVFSAQVVAFTRKLTRAITDEQDHPTAKLKLAMSAAIHNRGADEVSAFAVHTFNMARPSTCPPIFMSSCVLEFDFSTLDSVTHSIQFTCPDLGGKTSAVHVEVLDPRLGPNLLDRTCLEFYPRSFQLAELSEEELEVTVNLLDDCLDGTTSLMVPLVLKSNGTKWRMFLLCVLTTPTLKQKNRLSTLVSNDHSSELWGETMSSQDLSAAGMADLLDDLTKMPESKGGATKKQKKKPPSAPVVSPPAPRVERASSNSSIQPLLRSSESSVITKVVSSSRTRTGSAGNREDLPPDSSPRSVLANVRARFTRNRSASSGNEDEKGASSPSVAAKEKKSPRSPRAEDAAVVAAALPKTKSKTELGARPTALQSREKSADKIAVRKREPGGEERRPGWVASLERARDDPQLQQLHVALKEKATSGEKKDEKKPEQKSGEKKDEKKPEQKSGEKKDEKKPEQKPPSFDKKSLPAPPPPKQLGGGPPKKKLPSPRSKDAESDSDTPIMVEIDSSEFKN